MLTETTNRVDYISHPVQPLVPRPPEQYQPTEGKMEKLTEYKLEYLPKSASKPAKPVVPAQAWVTSTKSPFDSSTTHGVDFVPWVPTPRESFKEQRVYEPSKDKFEGLSTVQYDYTAKNLTHPTASFKPAQKANICQDPFEGKTSYRVEYIPHPPTARYCKEREVYTPNKAKFLGTSTFQQDFQEYKGVKRAETKRPPQVASSSEGPFEGSTTYGCNYMPWTIPTKFRRAPQVYEPSTAKFHQRVLDYPDYGPVPPTASTRPAQNARIFPSTPFNGDTTQNIDFRHWKEYEKATPVKPEKAYTPTKERFDGVSTFTASFRGETAPPAASHKPVAAAYTPNGQMQSATEYKECYTPRQSHRQGPCPIILIERDQQESPNNYRYTHQDTMGHKYYTTASPKLVQKVSA